MLRRSVMIALAMCVSGLRLEVKVSANGLHLASGVGAQVSTEGLVTTVRSFAFSALSLSNGKAVGANLIDIRQTNGVSRSFLMSIESMAVEGKQAVLIGTVLWSTRPTEIGLPAIFGVEDNGAGKKQTQPDRLTNVLGFSVSDNVLPDYTVKQLSKLAANGVLIPIDGITQALGLNFGFPPLTNLTLGNIVVK
jgi:hypothetical protein